LHLPKGVLNVHLVHGLNVTNLKGGKDMNTVKVNFSKLHPEAKIPSKRVEDMGFDIYACFDDDYIVVPPHETKMIPTGLASSCDTGYGFLLRERGSTGSKGIALRCGVIDSGYRDEWFVALTNTTNDRLYISKLSKEELETKYGKYGMNFAFSLIYPYSKAIAQALIIPVPVVEVEEIPYEELKEISSERGLGKLGSSNK